MRIFVCGLLLLAACEDKEPAKAAPAAKGLVLRVAKLHEKMRVYIDAKVSDLAWKQLPELVVPLSGDGVSSVRLKAVHDGRRLYMLAVWDDATTSWNRYWEYVALGEWKKHVGEDAFSICWSPGALNGKFKEQGCALFCHDGRHMYADRGPGADYADFWYWGAQQTGAKPVLRDMWMPFGEKHRLRGDSQGNDSDNQYNLSKEYEGPWGVPRMVGKRRSPFFLDKSNAQPLTRKQLVEKLDLKENLGWKVALDIQRPINGSRADVLARGRKREKVWVLETSRLLNTGNPDDQILNPDAGVSVFFSVAIHEGTEKDAHTTSPPIELRFVTRKWSAAGGNTDTRDE